MASPNWRLFVCGINHRSSNLQDRERLGFGHEDIAAANADFSRKSDVIESAIVSTCNRVEFYFVAGRRVDAFEVVRSFYSAIRDIDLVPLKDSFYVMRDRQAAAHLFRVAGGLDSMVLGENQILGQVKDAYSSACAVKAAGKVIHRLFHQAFRVGKQIRTDTEMGKGACSVASAAMELLRSRLNGLSEPSVLFVGVNQMIALAASNLSREQHGPFVFANRTPEKAVAMAERYEGAGHALNALPELLPAADVLITCTGAEEPVVTVPMMERALAERNGRRLLVIDMAIPRDVAFDANGHGTVEVYDLEAVQRHVREQQERRQAAIPQAEEIVDRRLGEFMYWFDHVRREPVAASVAEALEQIRESELAPVLEKLPEASRDEVNEATRRLVQKLLQLTAKNCSKCTKSE